MKRSGPEHAGPARIFVVRVLLVVTISFLLAGGTMSAMISMGMHPLNWYPG